MFVLLIEIIKDVSGTAVFSAKKTELAGQLKSNKAQVNSAKQELAEYKDKATRILQVHA